ncbi:MAG TPA: hypothetical protein VGA36_04720 [Nitriliruptorales bacterium]
MTAVVDHPPTAVGSGLRSPFGPLAPALTVAAAYVAASLTWVVAGAQLPGGRWLAVHLFTLGLLTNLILAFAEHFGRTLTRTPGSMPAWQLPVVNVGIVATLAGLPGGQRWLTGTGAMILMVVVFASYVRLRRMRRSALGARFGWIVRVHERAHGAFIHGAALGLLMGVGVLDGAWYGSARLAHLHVNLLGWGGLTLLATLVFFGPTMARTRIVTGSDDRAARALRHGATSLTIGVLALLGTGVGGAPSTALRMVSAAGLAVFAWSVVVTCWPVALAARGGARTASRWPVIWLCSWFALVVWVDVAVVATGSWSRLDALGLALLLGVLAQAMLATILHVLPLMVRDDRVRAAARDRLDRAAALRAGLWNLGAAAVVVAALVRGSGPGAALARTGWALVLAAVAWTVVVAAGARTQAVRAGR